jgi:hypothetical protein
MRILEPGNDEPASEIRDCGVFVGKRADVFVVTNRYDTVAGYGHGFGLRSFLVSCPKHAVDEDPFDIVHRLSYSRLNRPCQYQCCRSSDGDDTSTVHIASLGAEGTASKRCMLPGIESTNTLVGAYRCRNGRSIYHSYNCGPPLALGNIWPNAHMRSSR